MRHPLALLRQMVEMGERSRVGTIQSGASVGFELIVGDRPYVRRSTERRNGKTGGRKGQEGR